MITRSGQLTLVCAAILAQAAAHAETMTLGEVLVTAQKREERTVDIPMSVTVLSERSLELRGIDLNYRDKAHSTDLFTYYPEFVTHSSDNFSLFNARLGAKFRRATFELFVNNPTDFNKLVDPFAI